MRAFLLITLLLFCQLFNGSVAMEREDVDMVSALFEKYSMENLQMLDMYLAGKIFVERYTDAQLNDREKIKETVMKNIFPAYSKNNESQVEEEQCKNVVEELGLSHKEIFEAYFNAYLLQVDDAWKIRKVDGDEVYYETVDGNNIMDLVEFLYAMSSLGDSKANYNVKKLLTLIQVKHQIEEDLEKAQRYMMSFEKKFWDEHDLGSDLIQKASHTIYTINYFNLPNGPDNSRGGYYGLDGQMMYGNFSTFGNVTYGWLLEHHLDTDTCYQALNQLPYMRGIYIDYIKNKIELEKKKSEGSVEQPQHAFGYQYKHNSMGILVF